MRPPRFRLSFALTIALLLGVSPASSIVRASSLKPESRPVSPESSAGEPSASARPDQPLLEQADTAFNDGDHERALSLYRAVLKEDPNNLEALRRTGLLLGWAGQPGEAIPLLQKAVGLEPSNRLTRQQLARVYSWNAKYAESLHEYEALLSEDPTDAPTALEHARVLAWDGRLGDSEQAYRTVLQREPENTEATLGLAQCLGWQGRLDESAELYRAVLPKDPTPARLGLGRVSLWRGDTAEALRAARTELAIDPKNKDAIELQQAALDRNRPSLRATVDGTTDTDDNRTISTAATGTFHPGGNVDLDVSLTQMNERGIDLQAQRFDGFDLTGDGVADISDGDDLQELSATVIGASAGFKAGSRGRLSLGAGIERLGSYERQAPLADRGSETRLSGSAAYRLITSPITYRFGLASEIPKWTAYITENDLRWNHGAVGLDGPLPWSISWTVNLDVGQITGGSADNSRRSFLARARRSFDLGGPSISPRYSFRYFAYDLNLLDGYFDPQRYVSNTIGADLAGKFGAGKFQWIFGADLGVENFRFDDEDESVCDVFVNSADATLCRTAPAIQSPPNTPREVRIANSRGSSVESGNNTIVGVLGRLTWTVREKLSFEAYASWNDSAAQSASGYQSRSFGLAARIGF